MAERPLSRINRRAFSWRWARSSTVIGLASPRSVLRAAMAGGRGFSDSAAFAGVGKAAAPATREPVRRKWRRENMKPPGKEDHYIEGLAEVVSLHGWTGETPVAP